MSKSPRKTEQSAETSAIPDAYAGYVEHPRYGHRPRFTSLNPDRTKQAVRLHSNVGRFQYTAKELQAFERVLGRPLKFHDDGSRMVPGTAVAADLSRQTPATIAVTHYYDIDKACRDCGKRFIFFADEQKHWYEELGFSLDADAVRCPLCRKQLQQIARQRRRYEKLTHVPALTLAETMEMADCCLTMIEEKLFHQRQTEHVRRLLNRVPEENRSAAPFPELTDRLHALELKSKNEPETTGDQP